MRPSLCYQEKLVEEVLGVSRQFTSFTHIVSRGLSPQEAVHIVLLLLYNRVGLKILQISLHIPVNKAKICSQID